MKRLLQVLILPLVFLSSLNSSNLYINLVDFMLLTSKANNIRIVADESLDTSTYNFVYESKDNLSIDEFKAILKQKNLNLYKQDNLYIVSDKDLRKSELREIKFKNFSSSIIHSIVGLYDINSTYIPHSNSLFFISDDDTYTRIKSFSKDLDVMPKVATFKLVITETNLKDIKDKGTDLNSILKPLSKGDFTLFVNLITSPYMVSNNIIKDRGSAYFGVLKFLESNGLTKIISSPFITAFNDTEVSFSSVTNIPFLTSQSQTSNNGTSSTSSYNYKDVGLKINLRPLFLESGIKLDLHLVLEDILNDSTTPTTSKKELKSSYFLNRGEVLVLSGINKNTKTTLRNGIPILKDIWLLKYLFSIEQDIDIDSVLTLSIEVI